MRGNRIFVVIVMALVGVVGASILYARGSAEQAGQVRTPQNLQVLPKDWTYQQVQMHMRTFTAALGVECTHCHVGTMADRAKDDNPKKALARKMIQMTNAINGDMMKGIGDPAPAGTAKVTCFTCHRGQLKPLTAPAGGGVLPGFAH